MGFDGAEHCKCQDVIIVLPRDAHGSLFLAVCERALALYKSLCLLFFFFYMVGEIIVCSMLQVIVECTVFCFYSTGWIIHPDQLQTYITKHDVLK